jgi:hypothetical protein
MIDQKRQIAKSPGQGAATTVWAAIGKVCEGRGGGFLADCNEIQPRSNDGDMNKSTCASHTYDAKSEARL